MRGQHALRRPLEGDVDVPLEGAVETVLTTHHVTLEPGFVVLPALSGALLK